MEQVKFLGQISTIMRSLTSKVGDFLSHFDNVFEKNTAADFNSTSFKQILIHIHKQEANKGKIKGQLKLEIIIAFCKTFKKVLKNLGIHLTLKTNDEQNFIFTTKATDINVTISSFYLFVLKFFQIPKHKFCLMNLSKVIIQSDIIHGIQNVNYQPMVMKLKLISIVLNKLIIANF